MTELKSEMVTFFQTASIDELSLIGGCSVKKAQRIVELRPFDTWQSLVRELNAVAFNTSDNVHLLTKSHITVEESPLLTLINAATKILL